MNDNLADLMKYKAALENVYKLQTKLEQSNKKIEKTKVFENMTDHLKKAGKTLEGFTNHLKKNVRKEFLGVTAAAMLKVNTLLGGPRLKIQTQQKPFNQKADSIIPKKPKNIRERILYKHFKEKPGQMASWLQGTKLNKGYQKIRAPLGHKPIHESGIGKGIGKIFSNISPVTEAFLDAAKTSSQSFGIIRSGTGATKETLDILMESYRKVGSAVPQNLSEVAKTIAIVHKKTGMTGASLESLAKTTLDVSRVMGTDSATTAESAAKAMGTWGISAENSTQMMDKFFVASRATDMGMNDLMNKMAEFGKPLQNMGLGFDQSLALLAKWESQGIHSIKDALVNELPTGGIEEVAKQIKSAGTAMEKSQIASRYFSSALSQDLVNALNGSKVEFKGVLEAMNSSENAISKHTGAVQSFGDRWDTLKNKMSIAMAPVGEIILPMAEKLISVLDWVKKYSDILIPSIIAMGAVLLGFLVPSLWASAAAGWAAIVPYLPMIAIIALVGAAVAGLAYLYHYKMDEIKQFTQDVLDWIKAQWEKITNFFSGIADSFTSFFSDSQDITVQGNATVTAQGPSISAASQPAGSFYHGLDYVPYDGMLARLHKGERVLTSRENQAYSQGQGSSIAISISGNTFNVRQESDIDSIARALAREIKAAGGLMA